MRTLIYSAALLSGLLPLAAEAQEVPSADPVVVTASRLPGPLSQATASTTIITRERIRELNPESVAELLQTVPGLHVNRVGGAGGLSQIFLRGADPNFTMFLIDGIQVNNPTDTRGGTFDVAALNPLNIERIEIVRGPLSSVYGSEALGGVVNIITRGGGLEAAMRSDVAADLGVDGQRRFGGSVRANIAGDGNVVLTAGHLDVGNRVTGTGRKVSDASARTRMIVSDDTEISVTGRFATSDSQRFPDDSGGPELAVRRTTETMDSKDITVGAEISKAITDSWSGVVRASLFRNDSRRISPGVAPGTRDPFGIPASSSDDSYQRFNASHFHRFDIGDDLDLTLGADVRKEQGDSRGFLSIFGPPTPTVFSLDRDTVGAYFEARYQGIPDLTVDAAIRSDWPDSADQETSPRIGLAWSPSGTGTTIRASWSEGFKLPSFFALADPFVGNPALVPETSRSFEVGIEQRLWSNKARVGVSVFRSDFFNLVDFDAGPPPRLVNRSNVRSEGFEVEADLSVSREIALSAFAAYAKTENRSDGSSLRNRPKWRGGAQLRWRPVRAVSVSANLQYTGGTLDSSVPTGDRRLDDYVLADLSAAWRPADRWVLRAAVENLFDTSYRETIGTPAAGITARLGAQHSF